MKTGLQLLILLNSQKEIFHKEGNAHIGQALWLSNKEMCVSVRLKKLTDTLIGNEPITMSTLIGNEPIMM